MIFKTIQTKIILFSFFIIFISNAIIGFYGYSKTSQAYIEESKKIAKESIETAHEKMNNFFQLIPNDLDFLSTFYGFEKYLSWKIVNDEGKKIYWKKVTTDTFRSFLNSKDYYQGIKFINNENITELEVSKDPNKQTKEYFEPQNLHNFAEYKLFEESIKNNKLYFVSPITLDEIHGNIIKPFRPIIHFAIKIKNSFSQTDGILIIDVLATHFLDFIKKNNFTLIDQNGFFISHSDETKLFGFQLKNNNNLNFENPQLFKSVTSDNSGVFFDEQYIYAYQKIKIIHQKTDEYFVLINTINRSESFNKLKNFQNLFLIILSTILLLVFLVVYIYTKQLIQNLNTAAKKLQLLSKGNIEFGNRIKYKNKDEFGMIFSSLIDLTTSTKDLINRVQEISKGDYDRHLIPRSKQDNLIFAINNMTQTLKNNKELYEEQRWLEDGKNSLINAISGETSLKNTTDKALMFICQYLGFPVGTLYLYESEYSKLFLNATYSTTKLDTFQESFELGETLIGQVAKNKKAKLVNISNTNLTKISSSIINNTPNSTYIFPLIYENNLYGVIELLSFKKIDDRTISFLTLNAPIIATHIFTTSANTKMKYLLKTSEDAKKIAQSKAVELEQINEQIYMQQLELEKSNIELEKSNKYKSEFLANISHELKTPLNSIILLSKLLINNSNNLDPEVLKKIDIINSSGNDLLSLINNILDLSKIEAQEVEVFNSTFNSYAFIVEIENLFRDLSEQKDLNFIVKDEFNSLITTDRVKLGQIIKNFLSNSFKFTKDGFVSFIITHSEDKNFDLKIAIEDSGIGIPDEKQQEIFDAFKQVDGSITREYGGTGLGLYISSNLAKILNAKITIKSKLDSGSCFTIYIKNENQVTSETSQNIDTNINLSARKILIIDDDITTIFQISSILEEQNIEVFEAMEIEKAIKTLNATKLDLVIIKIDFIEENYLDVINIIKQNKIPIIGVIEQSSDRTFNDCIISGANGCLLKPFKNNELINSIANLLPN